MLHSDIYHCYIYHVVNLFLITVLMRMLCSLDARQCQHNLNYDRPTIWPNGVLSLLTFWWWCNPNQYKVRCKNLSYFQFWHLCWCCLLWEL